MKLRIAHVSATFPPYRGGTGNVCWQNARELARRGHNVTVLTAAVDGGSANEQRDGVRIKRITPLMRVGNAPLLPELLGALNGFDIIHLHYPFFGGELTTAAAWRNHTPLVVTYHQDVLLDGPLGLLATLLRHTVGRVTLRRAARVLFTSLDYAAASYVSPMLRDRPQSLAALPNGVDTVRFAPGAASSDIRAQHSIPHTAPLALLVAGLDRAHAFKGVDVLLRSLAQTSIAAWAVIVGDGALRSSYEQLARELGVAARVRFAGRVDDEALPDYYRCATVTVLPSVTMGEAFGLVLLESSNLPGVRTVVQDTVDGLLVPSGDERSLAAAIDDIARDPTRRTAMGTNGRMRIVGMYRWESIGERLEAIYGDILRETRSTLMPSIGET